MSPAQINCTKCFDPPSNLQQEQEEPWCFVRISIRRTGFHLPPGFPNDSNQLIFENEHRSNISNHSTTISNPSVWKQNYSSYTAYKHVHRICQISIRKYVSLWDETVWRSFWNPVSGDEAGIISGLNASSLPKWVPVTTSCHAKDLDADPHKCICTKCKMYLSELQNVFVWIAKCICRNSRIAPFGNRH